MNTTAATQTPRWMSYTLYLAGIYNVLWGGFIILYPNALFAWSNIAPPTYPQLWQCIGMIVGVYGIGYAIAGTRPLRHWPIVFVGFLGKIFGPIGFLQAVHTGALPWAFGWTIVTNDLIWWIPCGLILYRAYRHYVEEPHARQPVPASMAPLRTQTGETLEELSKTMPLLIVFLRHFGCTFCRETLADLSTRRTEIERQGSHIVLVHMEPNDAIAAWELAKYGLENAYRVSDPDRTLYRKFGLKRGTFRQLFGLKVWWRGFRASIINRHGVGWAKTDSFQMPGVFLFEQGQIVQAFRHNSAADRPNYESLALCEAANTRMRKDLDMAAQVQQALLPKSLPEVEGVTFSWTLNPTDELAGDTLNVMALDDEHVGLYVLDVCGHGISAALLSVTLNYWLSPRRSLFKQPDGNGSYKIVPPAEVAEKLNQQFPQDLETGQFFTLIYGILNTRTHVFRYVAAGHPGPIHMSVGAKPISIDAPGLPVGIVPNPGYENSEIQLNPGDQLYLYTDGLTETQSLDEEQFGTECVLTVIEQNQNLPLSEKVSSLVNGVRKWGDGSPYMDDIAVLALEIARSDESASAPRQQDAALAIT